MKKECVLKEILKLEAQIANLEVKKQELGEKYLNENFPFKKGDKITITFKDEHYVGVDKMHGIILMVKFDSHSHIKGLAKVLIKPMGRGGVVLEKRNAFFLDDEKVKEISTFKLPK